MSCLELVYALTQLHTEVIAMTTAIDSTCSNYCDSNPFHFMLDKFFITRFMHM